MKIFKLDNEYEAVCESEGTRYGFRHVAVLHWKGSEVFRTKICYYNRTWEAYQFQSVLEKLVNTYFKEDAYKDLRIKFNKTIAEKK